MSAQGKVDPARGWMFVEKLLAEEEALRVESLGDEDLDRELRDGGYDPVTVPSVEDLLARAKARAAERARAVEPARVVPIATPGRSRWAVLLAAAAFALLAAVILTSGRDEKRATIGPDNEWAPLPPPPGPHEKAEALRDEAVASCTRWFWAECRTKLDDAKKLDPAGEGADRVRALREQIAAGLNPDAGRDKPPFK